MWLSRTKARCTFLDFDHDSALHGRRGCLNQYFNVALSGCLGGDDPGCYNIFIEAGAKLCSRCLPLFVLTEPGEDYAPRPPPEEQEESIPPCA